MNEDKEVWKSIHEFKGIDFRGHYEISNLGRVRSIHRTITKEDGKSASYKSKILTIRLNHQNYKIVKMTNKGKTITSLVHRLLATYFIDNPNNLPIINHKDGNKINNDLSNLEWCTYSENTRHGFDTGLFKSERPVNQICLQTGNVLATFKSLDIAGKETKIHEQNIGKVCRGERPTAGGFKWSYVDEN